ncbi:hypothetical protein FHG87_005275 [Trinorchestia longiramus]|nr:hypothetical protein FHG87_005275 [Trinorchestia longiramus]
MTPKVFAHHLEGPRVPLVVRVPQIGNHCPNTRTRHKQVLDYKRANFELMKEELGSHNYEVLMSKKNTEECYMILKEKIATTTEHHIPRKPIRTTNNPSRFSQEI